MLLKRVNFWLRGLELCKAGAISGYTPLKKDLLPLLLSTSKGQLLLSTGFLAPEAPGEKTSLGVMWRISYLAEQSTSSFLS